MTNIRLEIEYDGTDYSGWQSQESAPHVATVAGMLTKAVSTVVNEEVDVFAASRTDKGVHAMAQVVNFHTSSLISIDGLLRGVNNLLPDDIVINKAEKVSDDFHARHSAKGKTYIYRIYNERDRSPLVGRYSWFIYNELDVDKMRESLQYFIGEMDFSSFRGPKSGDGSSVREILDFTVEERPFETGSIIEFTIKGTGFLRFMVRSMIGTVVRVGRGLIAPHDIKTIIEARNRQAAFETAPARGLFLKEVYY